MLDLNLNAPSSAFLNMVPYTMPSLCNSQIDSSGSGSFGSSVVCVDVSTNTCDDDSCSYGDAYTYNFDILKTNAVHDDHGSEAVEISKAEGDDACILVIQLFLSAGGGGNDLNELEVGHPFLNCSPKSWMNFSREDICCGGMPELRKHSGLQQRHQIKKNGRGPKSQSSDYRDVTFYRRTGRWESHIWDCGKQVYLGGFDSAHAAARAYDRAAIKFRGVDADINFNIIDYDDDIKQMSNFTREEFVDILRRQSTGFSRGSSKYRRVTLHKCGRWEARREQFLGKKAYDKAAMKWMGSEAVTNFEPSSYEREIISKADNEVYADGNQSLDLNLGIAPPCSSDSQKENLNLVSSFQDQRIRMTVLSSLPQDYRRLSGLAGCSAATFKHPSAWSSTNFLPSWKERAIEKNMEAGPSPNRSRTIQGPHGSAIQIPPFSAAASSGFPSTKTPSTAYSRSNYFSKHEDEGKFRY